MLLLAPRQSFSCEKHSYHTNIRPSDVSIGTSRPLVTTIVVAGVFSAGVIVDREGRAADGDVFVIDDGSVVISA